MQNLIVLLTVALAVFYIGRRLIKTFRSGNTPTCGCGCSGCSSASSCSSSKKSSS